jgi:hypothetical protein
MNTTIRQHYVTAGYLARFTLQGERDSPFFVHSLDGHVRRGTPESTAFERHYHTINVPHLAPDHLESIFQKIESPACALFRTLSEHPGRDLSESEKDILVMFLGVQAARVPQSRKKYDNLMVDCGRAFMEGVAYSPKFYGGVMAVAARHGVNTDSVTREWLREAVDSGHIFPVIDPTQSAVGIFRLTEAILDALDGMHYTLWYSDGAAFVCSDCPVGLFYSVSAENALDPASVETPTVTRLTDTIFMPLAHNVAVVIHKSNGVPTAQRANERMVAVVNACTVSQAQRFICSPREDFVCVLPDRQMGNAKRTLETLMSFN